MAKSFQIVCGPALLFLLAFIAPGCKENELNRFHTTELLINGKDIAISDSVFFITAEDSFKTIKINPDPSDASLYYSINNNSYEKALNETLHLEKGDTLLQFYHLKVGFYNSPVYTLIFTGHASSFLQQMELYPIPSDSVITMSVRNKSRGSIEWILLNVMGVIQQQGAGFKATDSFEATLNLSDFQRGIYLASVQIGEAKWTGRLIKEVSPKETETFMTAGRLEGSIKLPAVQDLKLLKM